MIIPQMCPSYRTEEIFDIKVYEAHQPRRSAALCLSSMSRIRDHNSAFYEQLQIVQESLPTGDIVVMMGDLNYKGSDNTLVPVTVMMDGLWISTTFVSHYW